MSNKIQRKGETLTETLTENKMGTMPIKKLLYSMSWPAILSMTINAFYNIVDSIFVAQISEDALSAVSIIAPLQFFIIAVSVGTGIGVNSLISRKLGAKDQQGADQTASTGVLIGFFNYLIFVLIAILLPKTFVGAYATEGTYLYNDAYNYLMIICLGSLFLNVQIEIEKILQSTGNMVGPMFCSLTGAIVNLILDPVLIFGLLGAPKMGVIGAALATVIGQVFGLTVAITLLVKGEHLVNIKLKGFKIDWQIIKEIYQVGLPSIIMQSIGSVMIILYNMILVQYSTTAVAVLGIYFKIQSFVFMPVFGLNQGTMPIIGYNFGAGNKKRVMEGYKEALKLALIVMTFGLIGFQLFPRYLLLMFDASNEMLEIGIPALRSISLCFIPAAIGIINGTMFQATGHGMYSLIVSVLRQLLGIIPIAYYLAKLGGVKLSWLSFPLAEILGLTYSIIMFYRLYKKEISRL